MQVERTILEKSAQAMGITAALRASVSSNGCTTLVSRPESVPAHRTQRKVSDNQAINGKNGNTQLAVRADVGPRNQRTGEDLAYENEPGVICHS